RHVHRSIGACRKDDVERGGNGRTQRDAVAAFESYRGVSAGIRHEAGAGRVIVEIDPAAAGDDRSPCRYFDRTYFVRVVAQQPDVEVAAGIFEIVVRTVVRYGDGNVGIGAERPLFVGLYGRERDGQDEVVAHRIARYHRVVGVEGFPGERDVSFNGEASGCRVLGGQGPVGEVRIPVAGGHDAYHVALRPRHLAVSVERRTAFRRAVYLFGRGPYLPFGRFRY